MAGSGVITIRPMTPADVPTILAIEQEVYPQPWAASVFIDELARANRSYVVVEDESTILGYAGMLLVERDAHVTTLAIAPGARRGRLGTRLMVALVDDALAMGASNLTLEVRASNQAAQRLYDRFGLAPVGFRKNYYRDEDALIMWAMDIDGDEYSHRLALIKEGLQ